MCMTVYVQYSISFESRPPNELHGWHLLVPESGNSNGLFGGRCIYLHLTKTNEKKRTLL